MSQKAIIITAPSGAGKTTIAQHLLTTYPNIRYSVSATTRGMREGEENGRDYYFLDLKTFEKKITEGAFVEYEQVYEGLYYGTLKSEIDRLWKDGYVILFVVDVMGALHLSHYFGKNALSIFIKAPSLDILAERLRARATEHGEILEERIRKAKDEMHFEDHFDAVLINDKLETAQKGVEQLVQIFLDPRVPK